LELLLHLTQKPFNLLFSKILLLRPPQFHFLSLFPPPPNVTSLGHSELEDDSEEDAEGDDAEDNPDHDEVAGAAPEALVLLCRRRRSFVPGGALPHW